MNHRYFRVPTLLSTALLILVVGCSRNKSQAQEGLTTKPLSETVSLGPLPDIPSAKIDTIILGSARDAAEALLDATLEERSALACVPLLIARLDECGEKMEDAVLIREEGQPIWMRLYSSLYDYSHGMPGRKQQILLRLADCIRETTPSLERAQTRKALIAAIKSDLSGAASYRIEIAQRSVMFTAPFSMGVESETGWDDLFGLLDDFIFSDASGVELTRDQMSDIASTYVYYCDSHPELEHEVVEKLKRAPGFFSVFSERLEFSKETARTSSLGPPPPCSESTYRSILKKSPTELIEIYAGQEHKEAMGIIEALLTGTRQARLESFPLVKPYLETYRGSRETYYQWVSLLRGYCVPVAENAASEEVERQEWLLDELIGQVDRNERGDPRFGTDPLRLLRYMIHPVTDLKVPDDPKYVQHPYGKERILEALLAQTVSTDTRVARTALAELDVLSKFDESTARSIEQGLTARKESILTKEYPSDDLSATSKEDLYKAMELTIKRAQAELK